MKRFSEQFKKNAANIRLRSDERQDLRERLTAYMEYHPLPAKMQTSLPKVKHNRFHTINLNAWLMGRALGTIAVLFLVVLPVVAEKAVPGDVLYPIKVRFNEELRGTLAFSPYQKVEWETERLERRISEARLLADAGKLTPEVEAEVAEAVKLHSEAAKQEIDVIRQNDSEEAAIAEITFTSALEVQSEVLEGHLEKNQSTESETGNQSITALAGAVKAVRDGVVPREGEKLSYEKLLVRIEQDTTQAYEYFDSIGEIASAEEKASIERRLNDIKTKVSSAINQTDDGEEAVKTLAAALSDTRKLISFMTNIDVRENVSIDDLLPVSLSVEERTEVIKQLVVDTEAIRLEIEVALSGMATTSDLYIEGSDKLKELSTKLEATKVALEKADIETAETTIKEVFAPAIDLKAVTVPKETDAEGEETNKATSTNAVKTENENGTGV